ncbi:MAG: ABC transporter substrate-binding protein [Bacteroidota bacterium]
MRVRRGLRSVSDSSIAVAVGLCLLFATLTGSPVMAASRTKIVWWGDVLDAKYTTKLIERFEQLHPEYDVEYQQQGWPINTKLTAAIAAGTPPDVVLLDRFELASWAYMGALEPLDDYIKRDKIDPSQWFAGTWAETQFNGQTWGLPHSTDSRLMYYNVDFFEGAGMDANRPPRTWKELEDAARKLNKWTSDGKLSRLGFSPTVHSNWYFYGWLWANGGEIVDPATDKLLFNSEIGRETLEWMVRFEDTINGGINKVDEFSANFTGYVGWGFYNEKLAMQIQTTSIDKDIIVYNPSMNWKATAVPIGPHGNKAVTWSGGFAMAIPKNSAHREAAWQFAKYVTSDLWAQTDLGLGVGWTPALVKAAHDEAFLKLSPNMPAFVAIMQVSLWRPVVPYATILSQILNDVMVLKTTRHELTAQAALSWAEEQLKIEIDKTKQVLQRRGERFSRSQ